MEPSYSMGELLKMPVPIDTPCVCTAACKDGRVVKRIAPEKGFCTISQREIFRYCIDTEPKKCFYSVFSLPKQAYDDYLKYAKQYRVTDSFTVERVEASIYPFTIVRADGAVMSKWKVEYKIVENGMHFLSAQRDIFEAYLEWVKGTAPTFYPVVDGQECTSESDLASDEDSHMTDDDCNVENKLSAGCSTYSSGRSTDRVTNHTIDRLLHAELPPGASVTTLGTSATTPPNLRQANGGPTEAHRDRAHVISQDAQEGVER